MSGRKHGDRVLIPKGANIELEDRAPLADAALFMNFARLECTESAVLAFAAAHGYLEADIKIHVFRRWQQEHAFQSVRLSADDEHVLGEELDGWFAKVRLMRLAIDLWQHSRGMVDDARLLRALIASHAEVLSHALYTHLRPRVAMRTRNDALLMAHALALREFAGHMFQEGLAWSFARVLPGNRYVLEVQPRTLNAGLWLQFAAAMAADAHYRQCEFSGCRGFFDAESSRKSRRYCSDSCKTRAYNKRQTEAAEKTVSRRSKKGH